jgi:hypothetical protein
VKDAPDYEAKMKYLCRRIIDNDMKVPVPEIADITNAKAEKRKRESDEKEKPGEGKRLKGVDGEAIPVTIINLDDGDGDEAWDEPFQGFPDRIKETRKE